MALTFNGTSSALTRSGATVSGYPFTLFAWTRATKAQVGFAVSLAVEPGAYGGYEGHGLLADGTRMRAWSTIGSSVSAFSSRAESLGDWVPCMVVFASNKLRKVYYGAGTVQTESTQVPQTPSLLNSLSIGKQALRSANYFAGDLASIGIWGTELTATDFAALAGGAVPSTVQPASLIDYWSLLTQAAAQTGINGNVLTAVGTAQAATHPITEAPGSADSTPPALSGAISVSALTSTSYTLGWPAGSDNVAITSYERSLDGGASWVDVGNTTALAVSGRAPGTVDQVQIRARDAAGNRSSPPLSTSVSLPVAPDTTAPTLLGTLTANTITGTSYVLTWPAASDNVAVTSYERSLDGGASWLDIGNVLSVTVTGRTAGTTDQVAVRAKDAAGNVSTPLTASVALAAAVDATAPVFTGSIATSSLTSTGYTLSWPAASDNVAVTSYERSLDGGSTWLDVGNVLASNVSGRTPGTIDQVRVRAKDAAGNASAPLATTVSLPSNGTGTITTPPLKNNTGTVLASLTGLVVNVYNASTGALLVRKQGLTSDASGVVVISDSAIVKGTTYAYEVVTPASGRRLPTTIAS